MLLCVEAILVEERTHQGKIKAHTIEDGNDYLLKRDEDIFRRLHNAWNTVMNFGASVAMMAQPSNHIARMESFIADVR
jgi:hypothetical protein